jgi:ABC-type Fe3+-hydroxamate transport system substrate-binding protein
VSSRSESDTLTDAAGKLHKPVSDTPRIVCLVPSLTELLFSLGLGDSLVGRTGFCVHPAQEVRRIPKVGGTKTVDTARVRKLRPTQLIVNIDENPRDLAEELSHFIPHTVVTHPVAPEDNLPLFRLFGGIFGCMDRAEALCQELEAELRLTLEHGREIPRETVLYLIWKAPWMTVSRDTYISRMLDLIGWDTVPDGTTVRYPVVDVGSPSMRALHQVLLSSEPYSFRERHVEAVKADLPDGSCARVSLIDGEMVSWYGSRAIAGLRYLRGLRSAAS